MARPLITIKLVNDRWEARVGGRRDPDLTEAVRIAAGDRALATQKKALRFVVGLINHRMSRDEAFDTFIAEGVFAARDRWNSYLDSLGYEVVEASNRIDGSFPVRRKGGGSVSGLSIGLAAATRLYGKLATMRLRSRANPGKIDGWHLETPSGKAELKIAMVGAGPNRHYAGSQYVAAGAAPSPLRLADPEGLASEMLSAGEAIDWPRAILDLVAFMGDSGARFVDTAPLTAADWARNSAFGQVAHAPNKASKGERVKQTVVSKPAVENLRKSFDENPSRPSMSELERLYAVKDWVALTEIFLFPSEHGRPFSYHVFNNDYVRPAMERSGLLIHSEAGSLRPTAHWMRTARVQEGGDFIHRDGRTDDEIKADERQLREDMHIKSIAAFDRYMDGARIRRKNKGLIQRTDDRIARRNDRMSKAPAHVKPLKPVSRAAQRLRDIEEKENRS